MGKTTGKATTKRGRKAAEKSATESGRLRKCDRNAPNGRTVVESHAVSQQARKRAQAACPRSREFGPGSVTVAQNSTENNGENCDVQSNGKNNGERRAGNRAERSSENRTKQVDMKPCAPVIIDVPEACGAAAAGGVSTGAGV